MNNRKMIGWAVTVLALVAVSMFFGVRYPIPPAPELEADAPMSRAVADKYYESLIVDKRLSVNGALAVGGNSTLAGAASLAGGALVVAVPTAAATATPAVYVNNTGATNDLLVLADSGTPVFKVSNSGAVTGQVLRYGSAGAVYVCGSATISGTGTLPHALATPQHVQLSLAQDVTGDCARLSYTNASAVVTAKCFNSAATPAAAKEAAVVDWCVVGVP